MAMHKNLKDSLNLKHELQKFQGIKITKKKIDDDLDPQYQEIDQAIKKLNLKDKQEL